MFGGSEREGKCSSTPVPLLGLEIEGRLWAERQIYGTVVQIKAVLINAGPGLELAPKESVQVPGSGWRSERSRQPALWPGRLGGL